MATDHPVGTVGETADCHRVTTMVPGHRWIVIRPGRKPSAPSPHRRDGRHARMVLVLRSHSQEVNGRQGKGAHVFVPRPRAMQATGALVGSQPQVTAVANRRDNNAGTAAQLNSSCRSLPMSRHLVPADAMSACDSAAIYLSMELTLCHYRRPQP